MNYETHSRTKWLAWTLATLLCACGAPEEGAEEPPPLAEPTGAETTPAETAARETPVPAPTLEQVQSIGVPNTGMPLDNVVTAGQPTQEQLSELVDLGYTNFVSLRPNTEEGTGWEEGIAADEGIQFARIPVAGAEGLTRENVLELDRILDEAAEEQTVLYCSSSNRVGALLALRAYWLEGADQQTALELGRNAGLSRLEPQVTELLAAPR
jgi:protein tyrosine phosphatase (PTP) superfamily phosphohydrolase (DUF442 family)